MRHSRRSFLQGCSAAIAAMAGTRFSTLAFGDPLAINQEILISIFLRGGMDGLNLVPPISGTDRGIYQAARPNIKIPVSGAGAALPLNAQFGLHPAAAPLREIWQDGKLAIVQNVGMQTVLNKSHFDAMQFIELGTPGSKSISTGWITRHLQTAPNLPTNVVMPSLAVGDLQPTSLLGHLETVNMTDPNAFNVGNGPWLWRHAQRTALRNMFEADSTWLHNAGLSAIDAMDIVELNVSGTYVPANGAVYPEGQFGDQMKVLAQMIKLGLGLQVATVDVGGWDTHDQEGDNGTGYFATMIGELSDGIGALYTDLSGAGAANYMNRITLTVQSEFGRELPENNDHGTEHGYGSVMMVLGGHVNGGLHGTWSGLGSGVLVDGTDVPVTTDYRRVLSEILIRRFGNNNLEAIFPGYTGYAPLGVVQGADSAPSAIFANGFEGGTTAGWSQTLSG
jgi:uncharacterized protein (DUF1501 family)